MLFRSVALVIVALALPGLMISVYRQIDGVGYLRDKSIAGWVAANKLTEERLRVRGNNVLLEEKESGVVEMAQRDWYWWSERSKTQVDQMFRVEINVATGEADQNTPLVTLVGFVAPDTIVAQGIPGVNSDGSSPGAESDAVSAETEQ